MAKNELGTALGAGGLLIGAGLAYDYLTNGGNSILGKLFGQKGAPIEEAPLKPGETSHSPYTIPVPTLRSPLPESTAANTDSSGALRIPMNYKKAVKGSLTDDDLDVAAHEVARVVFEDVSPYDPTTKHMVGDTQNIHDNVLRLMKGPDAPEILLKLAKFHADHGHNIYKSGSPLKQQQDKLVGTAADAYEEMIGIPRMYSRLGDENAREYDDQNDRLAAMGAESSIFFKVSNAWPAY